MAVAGNHICPHPFLQPSWFFPDFSWFLMMVPDFSWFLMMFPDFSWFWGGFFHGFFPMSQVQCLPVGRQTPRLGKGDPSRPWLRKNLRWVTLYHVWLPLGFECFNYVTINVELFFVYMSDWYYSADVCCQFGPSNQQLFFVFCMVSKIKAAVYKSTY